MWLYPTFVPVNVRPARVSCSVSAQAFARRRRTALAAEAEAEMVVAPLPPLTPLQQRTFDYTGLEAAMAFADAAIQRTRRALNEVSSRNSWTPRKTPSGLRLEVVP